MAVKQLSNKIQVCIFLGSNFNAIAIECIGNYTGKNIKIARFPFEQQPKVTRNKRFFLHDKLIKKMELNYQLNIVWFEAKNAIFAQSMCNGCLNCIFSIFWDWIFVFFLKKNCHLFSSVIKKIFNKWFWAQRVEVKSIGVFLIDNILTILRYSKVSIYQCCFGHCIGHVHCTHLYRRVNDCFCMHICVPSL